VNVLSLIHPHVYFPTYSNSLKQVGKHLWCEQVNLEASGLESIIWRTRWENEHDPEWKAKLADYNRTDCLVLR
jgi:predicted RecB family nuclease